MSESTSPIVMLENEAVNLDVIVELPILDRADATLEANPDSGINIDAVINDAVISDAVDDWFQPRPCTSSSGKSRRLPSGRKNIKVMGKSVRSPSPAPSYASAAAEDSTGSNGDEDGEGLRFLEEEQQRRAAEDARRMDWCRRAVTVRDYHEKRFNKARELVSSLKGEEKSIRNQREALRAQLRALDEQELSLDKRKRSALQSMKNHGAIVAKYKAMNI